MKLPLFKNKNTYSIKSSWDFLEEEDEINHDFVLKVSKSPCRTGRSRRQSKLSDDTIDIASAWSK